MSTRAGCFSPSRLTPNFPHFNSDPTDSFTLSASDIDFRDFEYLLYFPENITYLRLIIN